MNSWTTIVMILKHETHVVDKGSQWVAIEARFPRVEVSSSSKEARAYQLVQCVQRQISAKGSGPGSSSSSELAP